MVLLRALVRDVAGPAASVALVLMVGRLVVLDRGCRRVGDVPKSATARSMCLLREGMHLALLVLLVKRVGRGALAGDDVPEAAAAGGVHRIAGAGAGDDCGLAGAAARDIAKAASAGRLGGVAAALFGSAQNLALARVRALRDLARGRAHVAGTSAAGREDLSVLGGNGLPAAR